MGKHGIKEKDLAHLGPRARKQAMEQLGLTESDLAPKTCPGCGAPVEGKRCKHCDRAHRRAQSQERKQNEAQVVYVTEEVAQQTSSGLAGWTPILIFLAVCLGPAVLIFLAIVWGIITS